MNENPQTDFETADSPSALEEGFDVFVGNIPEGTLITDLEAIFSKVGKVLNVTVRFNRVWGYGFIRYATDLECTRAIADLHGHNLKGSQLRVAYSKTQATTRVPPALPTPQPLSLKDSFGGSIGRRLVDKCPSRVRSRSPTRSPSPPLSKRRWSDFTPSHIRTPSLSPHPRPLLLPPDPISLSHTLPWLPYHSTLQRPVTFGYLPPKRTDARHESRPAHVLPRAWLGRFVCLSTRIFLPLLPPFREVKEGRKGDCGRAVSSDRGLRFAHHKISHFETS